MIHLRKKIFAYVKHQYRDEHGSHLLMKPDLFQLALEEQQHSLEKLEIKLRLHDQKSLINLRHFTSLKDLKVEVLLLIWRPSMGLETSLCNALPSSLKKLSLNFCTWCSNILFSRYVKEIDHDVFEAVGFHLRAIAGRSRSLESLHISLPRLIPSKDGGTPEEWKATKRMAEELFKPTGIELVIEFSMSGVPSYNDLDCRKRYSMK